MSETVQRNTPEEIIAVVQAWQRGEVIENFDIELRRGFYPTQKPTWDFENYHYRPKPKPREFWINEYRNSSTGSVVNRAVHESPEHAACGRGASSANCETIHVREVL